MAMEMVSLRLDRLEARRLLWGCGFNRPTQQLGEIAEQVL